MFLFYICLIPVVLVLLGRFLKSDSGNNVKRLVNDSTELMSRSVNTALQASNAYFDATDYERVNAMVDLTEKEVQRFESTPIGGIYVHTSQLDMFMRERRTPTFNINKWTKKSDKIEDMFLNK